MRRRSRRTAPHLMPIHQAILLGIVQGLTEFLPVSSSAHLVVIPWLLGWPAPSIVFDVSLHMGTLVAVVGYFARDWWRMGTSLLAALLRRAPWNADARLGLGFVLGSIPAGVAGLLLEDWIEAHFHSSDPAMRTRSMLVLATTLATLGIVLWIADRRASSRRGVADATLSDALAIGCAQALALVPGVSRSGATITAGLLRGFDRAAAARYSFLLGVPILVAAGGKQALDVATGKVPFEDPAAFAAGLLASAVVGVFCIRFLLRYLEVRSTLVFAIYRIALAAGLLALVFLGR